MVITLLGFSSLRAQVLLVYLVARETNLSLEQYITSIGMSNMSGTTEKEKALIPEGIGLEILNRILLAYLKAGANEKAINYMDAAARSGAHHTKVSLNNKFLVAANFLTEEGRGTFKLTEKATKYTQMLDWGRLEEAKEPLREILNDYTLVRTVIDYITINNRVSRDDLITKIVSMSGVTKKTRYVTGVNTMIDMLTFSGLVREDDGMLTYVEKPPKPVPEITLPTPSLEKKVGPTPREPIVPITIAISVTESTDVEKLKAVIKAIKEALQD